MGSIPGGGTMEGWIDIGVDGVHTWGRGGMEGSIPGEGDHGWMD